MNSAAEICKQTCKLKHTINWKDELCRERMSMRLTFLYRFTRLESSNGKYPASKTKSMTPQDHKSAVDPSYPRSFRTCIEIVIVIIIWHPRNQKLKRKKKIYNWKYTIWHTLTPTHLWSNIIWSSTRSMKQAIILQDENNMKIKCLYFLAKSRFTLRFSN